MILDEQFHRVKTLLDPSKTVWIFVPSYPTLDQVCAGLVLNNILKRAGKNVELVLLHREELLLRFVPELKSLPAVKVHWGTKVTLDVSFQGDLPTFKREEGALSTIFPGVHLPASQVHISPWQESCDVVLVIGAQQREALGEEYRQFAHVFGASPVILLDTHIATEAWGEVNLIDAKLSGVSELVSSLVSTLFPTDQLTPREATLLYMGVVDATKGFSIRNQNPKTYELVSQLITLGADNAGIIQQFYFAKNLSELKIWGRALARLEKDAYRKIIWSRVSKSDLEKTGSTSAEARTVLDEMMVQTPEADIACLFIEFDGRTEVGVRSKLGGFPLIETFWKYSPLGGNDRLFFIVSLPLGDAERTILEELSFAWDRLRGR